jgi:sucrose phosphorylase
MNNSDYGTVLRDRLREHLRNLYPADDLDALTRELLDAMDLNGDSTVGPSRRNNWDESDIVAITYGDTVQSPGEKPLSTLTRFLNERMTGVVSGIHVLPFNPSSSDDGFSVIDYVEVDPQLGGWSDIIALAGRFKLMADLVINHASAESTWFKNFQNGVKPGTDYFATAEPADDLSKVVRPRSSPLLHEVETKDGPRHVWCTFSADQVDLNFKNPRVLVEVVRIIALYLRKGVKLFRLDAVAFLWKEPGTTCVHLPQTHELIKLLRTLIEQCAPDAVLITETNVPNRENLTYFGNANEAHAIYNFSLPPLLVHALLTGTNSHLKTWMMSMPPAQLGTAYLNFIASHDGIGLRPTEGLLSDDEIGSFIDTMKRFGGQITTRRTPDGTDKPYEINISLYDALQGTVEGGPDGLQEARFICAHIIMFALEGIPAIYIHSLLATENDQEKLARTGHNRSINRRQWDYEELNRLLDRPASHHRRVFAELCRLLRIRRRQPAFHPNATQYTLHLGPNLFAFWRQSVNRDQSIFAINNITREPQEVSLEAINLIGTDEWMDLIRGGRIEDRGGKFVLGPYQCAWLTNLF